MYMLSDGLPHRIEELHTCLYDDLGATINLLMHFTRMRKRLRPQGRDIACITINKSSTYQLVRTLASANDGRR
jgi:hypothetical protein